MQYYLQRSEGGYVGNCLLWWKKGGHGYTCDLKEAEVFDEYDQTFRQILTYEDGSKSKKYTAWEKGYIDSCASLFVDHQNLNTTLSGVDNKLLSEHPNLLPCSDDFTYSSNQATNCAVCGQYKHTPLRNDVMGGYVCLTCINAELVKLQSIMMSELG